MYKLVFLLVFSVLADSGTTLEGYSGRVKTDVSYLSQAKMTNDFLIQERESETYPSASKALNVYFDISFTTNNEGTTTVNLNINPGGVIQVSEGQKIQFYATTVTDLCDFGCTNDKGITVIVPKIKLVQEDGIKKLWSLTESKQYSKTDIGERWDCFYDILQPDGTIVNARKIERKGNIYIQDEFSLQLQIIEPKPSTPSHPYQLRSKGPIPTAESSAQLQTPTQASHRRPKTHTDTLTSISLDIKELNDHVFEIKHQDLKTYNVSFTYEETIQYECVLSNPTSNIVKYKMSYYVDGRLKTNGTVTLQPYSNESLIYKFSVKKADQTIRCSAVDQGTHRDAPNPGVEINLHYVPPPPIFPAIVTPNVTRGRYFPENFTQIYYYNFTDGETTKFECDMKDNLNYQMALYTNDDQGSATYKQAIPVSRYFNLKKDNTIIKCVVWDPQNKRHLHNIVLLHRNTASSDTPELTITGSIKLQKRVFTENSIQMYNYTFASVERVKLSCNAICTNSTNTHYDLTFYLDGIQMSKKEKVTFIDETFELKEDSQNITCVALDTTQRHLATAVVQLQYNPVNDHASSVVDLSISGLPDDSCEEIDSTNKKCSYTFEYESLKHTLSLNCTLTGEHTAEYSMSFGDKNTTALTANEVTALPNTITLNDRNETIECRARRKQGGNPFSVVLYINYIPPPPNESTTEQSTPMAVKPTTQGPSSAGLGSKDETSAAGNEIPWWLKFALGGGVAIIAICVVVCIIVCYRKKKPLPDDLTYENLAKDQKNYATLPVAAPRTLQNVKTKVTVERTYSEPKDSKDKSEALYADPNRCNPTETYAEPYVKSGSNQNPYAEPYMPKRDYTAIGNQSEAGYAAIGNSEAGYAAIGNSEGGYAAIGNSEGGYAAIGNSEGGYAAIGAKSEGNYAKIGENNSENKELYAKPIPKAQRPFKAKNESDYSNVFKELYANANKK